MSIKIINIVGARPNFIKIAPIIEEQNKDKNFEPLLLHTGQHYDSNMSDIFFEELKIPKPDIFLGVGSASHAKQVAQIMEKFDDVCVEYKPDAILVVGDVNSTMACSLVAVKYGIKVIHLEAGLRSFDRTMPEEINRIVTDSIADILLTPSLDANQNLLKEGIDPQRIYFIGNIMIDTLFRNNQFLDNTKIFDSLSLKKGKYVLLTLHRPSNVDDKDSLKRILNTLNEIQSKINIVFPIHPRTLKNIKKFGFENLIENMKNMIITKPLGYLDFQKIMLNAKFVITDSGGIQEETTALKIPCLTLRENTERPITILEGSNVLIGNDMTKLKNLSNDILNGNWKASKIPKFWDGQTSKRVIKILKNNL